MPAPQAILCHLCNGKYFKRSYPIHLKQCEAKWKKTHSRCEYCGSAVSNHDWSDHRIHCKPTKRRKISKTTENMPLEVPKSDYQQIIPTLANNAKVSECEECEAENAVWQCLQCEQSLCAMCEVDLHRKGARSRHTRFPMNADALKQENLSKLRNSDYKQNELSPPKADPSHDSRAQCKFCSRRFNPERVEKHMRICSKSLKKKRRKYDGAQKRIEGTDFEAYQYNRSKTPEKVKEWKKHGRRWRTESSAIRQIANVDSQAMRESDTKDNEELDIIIKAPSHKPMFKKAVSSPIYGTSRTATKSQMKASVTLKGSTVKMRQRPLSNTSNSSKDSTRNTKRTLKRNNVNKAAKEVRKSISNSNRSSNRSSRRQSASKKPQIPKFEKRKSVKKEVTEKRNMKRKPIKTRQRSNISNIVEKEKRVNVNETKMVEKENKREMQQPKTKKIRSEAKSLPRGIDLGVNVNQMFKDAPKTMEDYVQRERLRREERGKASNVIKKSSAKNKLEPAVAKKVPTKKMSRLQMKKEIRIDNQPIGGTRAGKPSNAKDLASKRANYFESLLQNQE